MTSAAFSWSHLQAWEGHESLVAQGGRAKRHFPHGNECLYERVVGGDVRGVETEGPSFYFSMDFFRNELEQFLIGVQFVAAHIYGEGALVRDDVVLRASIDYGNGGLHLP